MPTTKAAIAPPPPVMKLFSFSFTYCLIYAKILGSVRFENESQINSNRIDSRHMARVLKRCPKCSRKITNKIECKSCGLLFERYFKAENQKRAEETARAAKKNKIRQIASGSVSLLFVVIICGAAFYYFNVKEPASPSGNSAALATGQAGSTETAQPAGGQQDSETVSRAKQATVAIITPRGNGTGFFVGRDLLVTNRHIVEQKESGLAEARSSLETYRQSVAREYEKLQKMKQQYTEMADGSRKDDLGVIIKDGEEQYERARAEQQRREDRILETEKGLENSEILVILDNGEKIVVSSTNLSETHDLALLTVTGTDIEGIVLPPAGSPLVEGAQVSILGPKNASTTGTFNGFYRGETVNEFFIQIDRPFNASNSGAPLIDEEGYIRGVCTQTTHTLEGAGLAIPIATVISEFNL